MGGAALPAVLGAQAVGGGVTAWAQGQQGKAAGAYYGYLADTARTNSRIAQTVARSKNAEVSAQEGEASRQVSESVRSTVARERAAFAAGGPGAGSKTAEQIVSDSLARGDLDQIALRYNADLKRKGNNSTADFASLDYEGQAKGYGLSASNADMSSKIGQLSTILGTGTSVASTWYSSTLGPRRT